MVSRAGLLRWGHHPLPSAQGFQGIQCLIVLAQRGWVSWHGFKNKVLPPTQQPPFWMVSQGSISPSQMGVSDRCGIPEETWLHLPTGKVLELGIWFWILLLQKQQLLSPAELGAESWVQLPFIGFWCFRPCISSRAAMCHFTRSTGSNPVDRLLCCASFHKIIFMLS